MTSLGPYSRALRRGTIGASIDGRSAVGRFCRDLERQLAQHVAGPGASLGSLNIAQQLLVQRLVKTTVQINALDEKLERGDWTDHDARTHGGLINRQRLLLREIGLAPPAAQPRTSLAEHNRAIAEREARERAA
jgi:hypothetical protein